MYINKLKEMFTEMVIKKSPEKIPLYYHTDFMMYANNTTMDYEAFLKSHEDLYASQITYQVAYDHNTLLESGDKVAARVWITTQRPNEQATKIEVIMIVQFLDGKIYRLWELTHPDWTKLPAFENL